MAVIFIFDLKIKDSRSKNSQIGLHLTKEFLPSKETIFRLKGNLQNGRIYYKLYILEALMPPNKELIQCNKSI